MKRPVFAFTIFLILALFLTGCSLAYAPAVALLSKERQSETVQAASVENQKEEQVLEGPAVDEPQLAGSILDYQETFEKIYEEVNPSVVNIQVGSSAVGELSDPFQSGLGSGFVWDEEGHIVTNNHVVEGAGQILVTFSDGTTLEGEVVGTDPNSDLAVIKVNNAGGSLRPVKIADSSMVKVGQIAVAIGNPFGLAGTMTEGIVSARARSLPVGGSSLSSGSYTIPDIIQTNAAINPGNSGGVLVDVDGQVIGITAAIRTTNSNANSGIGFVIPSNIVTRVVPSLIENGAYEHPRMGVAGQSLSYQLNQSLGLDPDMRGVVVMEVVPDSPAARAKLQGADDQRKAGDIITAIDGQEIRSFEDLTTYLFYNTEIGQEIALTILRQGKEQEVKLTLGSVTP